jgi:hypothetical protein
MHGKLPPVSAALPESQIIYKKRVGSYGSKALYLLKGIGGINVVGAVGSGSMEILGMGSHPALARMLARQHDGVHFDDLEKSGSFDASTLDPALVAEWAEATALANDLIKRR